MKKTWNYNGVDYTMTKTGYGQYNLNGYHCTDSSIWDWCDDDENEEKMMEAWKAAERFVKDQD